MKITTSRVYRHENGYSGQKFKFELDVINGEIKLVNIRMPERISTDTLELMGKDLIKLANKVKETENGK